MARKVYPFGSPVKWALGNRYQHLIAIIEENPRLEGVWGARLRRRVKAIKWWLGVRFVLFILLFSGLLAAGVAFGVELFTQVRAADADVVEGYTSDARLVAERVARIAGSLSALFTVGIFAANRTLGQLEIDILGILLMRRQHMLPPGDAVVPTAPKPTAPKPTAVGPSNSNSASGILVPTVDGAHSARASEKERDPDATAPARERPKRNETRRRPPKKAAKKPPKKAAKKPTRTSAAKKPPKKPVRKTSAKKPPTRAKVGGRN